MLVQGETTSTVQKTLDVLQTLLFVQHKGRFWTRVSGFNRTLDSCVSVCVRRRRRLHLYWQCAWLLRVGGWVRVGVGGQLSTHTQPKRFLKKPTKQTNNRQFCRKRFSTSLIIEYLHYMWCNLHLFHGNSLEVINCSFVCYVVNGNEWLKTQLVSREGPVFIIANKSVSFSYWLEL